MQIPVPPVEPLPKVDIGELLLETVKAAPVLPVRLMDAVASYAEWLTRPVTTIDNGNKHLAEQLFGMPTEVDANQPKDELKFKHPDGRVDRFKIGAKA